MTSVARGSPGWPMPPGKAVAAAFGQPVTLASCSMVIHHTKVAKAKVAVTLESETLKRLDRVVRTGRYANRSQAVQAMVHEQLEHIEHRRLAEECAKLDRESEKELAETGLWEDAAAWPEY